MNLKNISTAELERQIKQIEQELEVRKIQPPPEPLANPDFQSVQVLCMKYIKELQEKGYADDDLPHYIFEESMTAVFGKDVWQWINSRKP